MKDLGFNILKIPRIHSYNGDQNHSCSQDQVKQKLLPKLQMPQPGEFEVDNL